MPRVLFLNRRWLRSTLTHLTCGVYDPHSLLSCEGGRGCGRNDLHRVSIPRRVPDVFQGSPGRTQQDQVHAHVKETPIASTARSANCLAARRRAAACMVEPPCWPSIPHLARYKFASTNLCGGEVSSELGSLRTYTLGLVRLNRHSCRVAQCC